jgi:Putative lumazine-binding
VKNIKRSFIVIAGFFLLSSLILSCGRSMDSKEAADVKQVCVDYMEGFSKGDADLLKKALHPEFVKRYTEGGGSVFTEMKGNQIIELSQRRKRPTPEYKITVIDVTGSIANVIIDSIVIEYLHLIKYEDNWHIANVMSVYK